MAQVNFYCPTKDSWWAVRVWNWLRPPRFTHCNFENGWGTVVDLGRDLPRGTSVKEAYRLRPVNGAVVLISESPNAMDRLADKYSKRPATKWRSLLYLMTGVRIGAIRNCATITSDWIQASDPTFPTCYTPDELWEACRERTHTKNPRWLLRMDAREVSVYDNGRRGIDR